jgi:membrane protease YdiL (CAAX protease family)
VERESETVPSARAFSALRIDPLDDPRSLFEFKRVAGIPAWLQAASVAGLFVATVFLCYAEYRAKGTCFGVAGPAFNALVCPIYEELIFRGWILGRLARQRGAWAAIVSSFSGLLHLRNIFWLDSLSLVRVILYAGVVLGPIWAT